MTEAATQPEPQAVPTPPAPAAPAEPVLEKPKYEAYDTKDETKIATALKKSLKELNEVSPEDRAYVDVKVVDPARVMLFIAKTQKMRRVLARFVEKLGSEPKEPAVNFVQMSGTPDPLFPARSLYSIELLHKVLAVFDAIPDDTAVEIKMGHDCPMALESDALRVWVAPRIEND